MSFILCLTVTHSKAVSGRGWGLGHLSWMAHFLGSDSRPACTLTLCPFSCPRVFQVHHVDDKPAEELTRIAQKEVGIWEDTGQNPADEGIKEHPPIGTRAQAGGRGWPQQTCTEHFMGVGLNSFPPHSNPVAMLILIPILQMGKLRCREINDLHQVIQLENGSTRAQSQLNKVPLCLRLRKNNQNLFLFHCIRNAI